MEKLPNDIEALKEIIRQLLERIRCLEAENAELRRRASVGQTGYSGQYGRFQSDQEPQRHR